MDSAELYRTTRDRVLPKDFKEHFESSKKSMEKNLEIIKNMAVPNSATTEGAALFQMFKILSDNVFSSLDSMNKDIEALYVYHCLNRERFSEIYQELKKHGIKLENIEGDEGLEWIHNYFEHASETTND